MVNGYDMSAVEEVKNRMIPDEYIQELSAFFKVFGEENRTRILYALSIREMCVNDLVTLLGMSQSSVSHQLQILRAHGQVKFRKEGRNVFYSLDDKHVVDVFQEALQHIVHRLKEKKEAENAKA